MLSLSKHGAGFFSSLLEPTFTLEQPESVIRTRRTSLHRVAAFWYT